MANRSDQSAFFCGLAGRLSVRRGENRGLRSVAPRRDHAGSVLAGDSHNDQAPPHPQADAVVSARRHDRRGRLYQAVLDDHSPVFRTHVPLDVFRRKAKGSDRARSQRQETRTEGLNSPEFMCVKPRPLCATAGLSSSDFNVAVKTNARVRWAVPLRSTHPTTENQTPSTLAPQP